MKMVEHKTDLPVVIVHNVDPSWESPDIASALEAVETMAASLRREGHVVVCVPVENRDLAGILQPFDPREHIILNWCEELPGISRSDTVAARILEDLRFVYTGSPPEVLSFTWDKAAVKALLDKTSIATPRWQVFQSHEKHDWNCFPAIVKPAFEHCSSGIDAESVVLNPEALKDRIIYVQDVFRQPALVEDFIDGREFHVTIWGNGTIEMLPPAEMDFSAFDDLRDRLCSFDSKFTPGSPHYEKIELRIPADLTEGEKRQLEQTAARAYKVTGCRDYARIDLRLRDGVFYVLDINPNADISPDTSLVYAAEAAGLTYGTFGSRLVNLAARRHPRGGP